MMRKKSRKCYVRWRRLSVSSERLSVGVGRGYRLSREPSRRRTFTVTYALCPHGPGAPSATSFAVAMHATSAQTMQTGPSTPRRLTPTPALLPTDTIAYTSRHDLNSFITQISLTRHAIVDQDASRRRSRCRTLPSPNIRLQLSLTLHSSLRNAPRTSRLQMTRRHSIVSTNRSAHSANSAHNTCNPFNPPSAH